jgi:hypothetical protein
MNEFDRENMAGESHISDYCLICGKPATERHHVVPRSRGGSKGPVVSVCGWGNITGCHGRLHTGRVHLRWNAEKRLWSRLCAPQGQSLSTPFAVDDGWVDMERGQQ